MLGKSSVRDHKILRETDHAVHQSRTRHIRKERHIPDVARRLRFLPCVKELLTESEEVPVPTRDGNLMLEGKAPTKERFRVVIRVVIGRGKVEDEQQTYMLVTFYPVTE